MIVRSRKPASLVFASWSAFSTLTALAPAAHAALADEAGAKAAASSNREAPSASGAPSAAAPALVPPRLHEVVPASVPAEAWQGRDTKEPTAVDLALTLDAQGHVTDARVLTSAGAPFDDAALAAAKAFLFDPARKGEVAIPARIKYRYVFTPPAPPAPTTGRFEGHVRDRAGDKPLAGAKVVIRTSTGATLATVVTDEEGAFGVDEIPPGSYRVEVKPTAGAAMSVEEEIAAGESTEVTYRVEEERATVGAKAPLEFGTTATVAAPAREVTKRTLEAEELMRMAGTRGDPLRGIEYMPGVARSPMANFVIIRGSSPADSEVQFEGAQVWRLYHFGGLTSFVQPRLVERIDLYPGNFSARYGRRMGGIIDVGVRDPKTDRLHGLIDVNIIDGSVLAEGPIAPHWSFAVAAKRSYIDLFFEKLVPKDKVQILAAPVYWDYQAMVVYKPSEDDRVRAMVFGSGDDFRLILSDAASSDPAIRGKLSTESHFHRGQLLWEHKYSPAFEHEITFAGGPFKFGQKIGPDLTFDIPGYEGFLRAEWRARFGQSLRLIGGLDMTDVWVDATYTGPRVRQLDGDPDSFGPLTGMENLSFQRRYNFWRPAAYLEAVWQATSRLTLVPGLRADYFADIDRKTVDPRLSARFQLTPSTILKAGVGRFSQAPDLGEVLPVIGNPHLQAPHAVHFSAGAEQLVGERLQLTAEGFYKRLSLLTVNSPVPGENLNNDGVGRIYGAELSARLRPSQKTTGFLSYTLSRSERNDHGEGWRLFNWDQTHILTLAGGYRLGRGWDLSGTFRYVTGNPYTPVASTVYDANADTYKAIYGGVNTARSSAFHRLDLRVEKVWEIGSGRLAAYLDVQNATNRQSDEGRIYNFDDTKSKTIPGLPVIPSLGFRGEI